MCIRDSTKTVIGVILASASTDVIHVQMEGLTASVQMWIVVVIICALALSIIPVSYTHLDVYKRQTVRFPVWQQEHLLPMW